jgi:integrase
VSAEKKHSSPAARPDPAQLEAEYAADVWEASRLGFAAQRGRSTISFGRLCQPWLRHSVKDWCRWRLATGCTWNTAATTVSALNRLSAFLAASEPGAEPTVITRAALERFVSWLTATGLAPASRSLTLISVRGFLELNRRHRWLPDIPADAAIYQDDLPRRDKPLPRFCSEFVMAQLEDPANLGLLEPTVRHLLVVLIETGLRANDACTLPFNPIVDDSVGWPCLRFVNHKARVEQVVPLSERAATAIRDQQAHVRRLWPEPGPWLFPDPARYHDGQPVAVSYSALQRRLRAWQDRIGLHDEASVPITVSPHQFRHTLGTRLINAGVPQHIVQRILGHASPGMTDVYARLHDSTIRAAFDAYCQQRVDIAGRILGYDPDAPAADAEWIKHNLSRVQASLPNGYCGRPPQQECPHPNACLTCPQFQTTVEFLAVHRQHARRNHKLIEIAERNGQDRLADNHRRVQVALDRIIPALEAVEADNGDPDDQGEVGRDD